jgi:hypothetical protein
MIGPGQFDAWGILLNVIVLVFVVDVIKGSFSLRKVRELSGRLNALKTPASRR